MKILLVEDDHLQADWLRERLQQKFRTAKIDLVRTEREFYVRLDKMTEDPPDVVIIDVMLPWEKPSPQQEPPPQEVREGGYQRAGIRCVRKLWQKEELQKKTAAILYSVLEANDLSRELAEFSSPIPLVTKQPDPEELIQAIYLALRRQKSH